MPVTFVDALADAIVRQITIDDGHEVSAASQRGVARGRPVGQQRAQTALRLGRRDVERVASAIAGRLGDADRRDELPLQAIEI